MKVLVVLCAVVASCLAKPYGYIGPVSAPISYSSVVSVSSPLAYAAAPAYAPAYGAVAPAYAPASVYAPAPALAYAAAPAPLVSAAPAVVAAAPAPAVAYAAAPAVVAAPVPAVAAKTQYHAQNEAGEASYGHSEPGQTHNAVQDAHGNKVGSFSYVNPEGHVLRTDYVADAAGYRVASNALPAAPIVAPIDTPEVAAAKAAFHSEYALRAAHLRRRRSLALVQTPASTAPLATPVVYSAPAVAPVAYAAPAVAPVAYAAPAFAPVAYSTPAVAPVAYSAPAVAPVAYSAPAVAPVAYSAPAVAPVAYSAPAVSHALPASRLATLTTVVNNPGHAVSYRVD